jgi:hypothetical protein
MRVRRLLCTAMAGGALSAGAADVQLFGIHVPATGKWAVYARISNPDLTTQSQGITKTAGLASVSINVLNNAGNTVTFVTNKLPYGTTDVSHIFNPDDPPQFQITENIGYGFWSFRRASLTALGAEHIEGGQVSGYPDVPDATTTSFVLQNTGLKGGAGSTAIGGQFTSATQWLYPLTVAQGTYTPGADSQTGLLINYPTGRGASVLRDTNPSEGDAVWSAPGNTEQSFNTIIIDPRYHTGSATPPANGVLGTIFGTTYRAGLGDTDLNGLCDLGDLIRLANHYGGRGTWFDGDFNLDGLVDLSDLIILANYYGSSTASDFATDVRIAFDQASAVPEPTALTPLLCGVLGLIGRRRRARHG